MAHKARANVNMEQQTTATLMRLNVPYLKNYVEGFPFGPIDLDISMYRLQRMFDHDPELHEVLHDIRLHLLALVNRYSVILPDGTTFLDMTGRNGADYHHEDWEDDEELDYGDAVVLGSDEVEPVSQCIKDCMSGLEELSAVWAENLNMLHAEFLRDQVLCEASVDLARRLNRGVQRLLNAEIVPLVYLLREEMLDQERRLKRMTSLITVLSMRLWSASSDFDKWTGLLIHEICQCSYFGVFVDRHIFQYMVLNLSLDYLP